MNRRGFLGLFAGALAGATLDQERALWIPGAKTISIPKPREWRYVTRYMLDGEISDAMISVFPVVGAMAFSEVMRKMASASDFDINFMPMNEIHLSKKIVVPTWS